MSGSWVYIKGNKPVTFAKENDEQEIKLMQEFETMLSKQHPALDEVDDQYVCDCENCME